MKYVVLIPRLMSGQKKGQIINFPNENRLLFELFGGVYKRQDE